MNFFPWKDAGQSARPWLGQCALRRRISAEKNVTFQKHPLQEVQH